MELSLTQAIGQKMMLAFFGTEPSDDILATIQRQHVGGITLFRAMNVVNPAQVRALTESLQQAARQSGQPPLLIGVDQEGGQLMAISGTTLFPGNLALGATRSLQLAKEVGKAIALELAAMGIHINYAPVCDVNINPQNPAVGTRSFGEDPQLVATMCAAMIEGIQEAGVAATAKHFPGHGDTHTDSHYGMPVVLHSEDRLREVELPPFIEAIKANVKLVMSAHIATPALSHGFELPATLSEALLTDLLRKQLGFKGVVISDALEMEAIGKGVGMIVDSVAAARAGVDLLLLNADVSIQQDVAAALLHAVQRTLLPQDLIMDSARRVIELKQWAQQQQQPDLEVVNSEAHRTLAQKVADQSVTLVRDEANLLPLKLASTARLAVVVPKPADLTPADTSSYELASIATSVRQYHASTDEFIIPINPGDEDLATLRKQLKGYDMVIVGTINATVHPGQATIVNELLKEKRPTIVVALRMPYDLTLYPSAPTFICTYSILPTAMEALAKALWGQIPFVGWLPVSIPGLYSAGHRMELSEAGRA